MNLLFVAPLTYEECIFQSSWVKSSLIFVGERPALLSYHFFEVQLWRGTKSAGCLNQSATVTLMEEPMHFLYKIKACPQACTGDEWQNTHAVHRNRAASGGLGETSKWCNEIVCNDETVSTIVPWQRKLARARRYTRSVSHTEQNASHISRTQRCTSKQKTADFEGEVRERMK